ncbi:NmrA family protein [Gloeomargarita lithophora Alchichica-D10]|uniref:NmrA family protein n=2 Tax=Gloeomargarita TaxID=1188227 RepID=A0A1J0AC41_9CYAN|nr:NmrA family protein [Gloeomargarita lithophora Alchichica-D10]
MGWYLVTGATGQIGRRVVHQLRQQGFPVRAWVRLGANYQDLVDAGAELYFGNVTQREDIWAAMGHVSYIISTHYHAKDILNIHLKSNLHLIEVAGKFGVECFAYISGLGVEQYAQNAPLIEAKLAIETALTKSSLNYIILRPTLLNHYLLPWLEQLQKTGSLILTGDGNLRHSWVSLDDLAKITIQLTQNPALWRQIVPVGGLTPLSRWDIIDLYRKLTQSQPMIIPVPLAFLDGVRWGLQWLNQDEDLGTLKILLSHEFICNESEQKRLQNQLNIQLESLEQFLQRYLGLDHSGKE